MVLDQKKKEKNNNDRGKKAYRIYKEGRRENSWLIKLIRVKQEDPVGENKLNEELSKEENGLLKP